MTGWATAFVGLGAVLAVLSLVWMLSVRLRDASIADVCWGLGFVLLAWLYWSLSPVLTSRSWLIVTLVTLWGTRLAVHIYRRNHGKGEDRRYQAMRAAHGPVFWWRSLLTVIWLQGTLLWFVSLPLLVAVRATQPAGLTVADGLGVMLFAIGFGFEAVGDHQLERFKVQPRNRGTVLESGLWRYTRHPNYFGDATVWWGLYAIAASTPGGWLTIRSPLLMTGLLMRVSGVTLLEEGLKTSKPGYPRTSRAHRRSFPGFHARRSERPRCRRAPRRALNALPGCRCVSALPRNEPPRQPERIDGRPCRSSFPDRSPQSCLRRPSVHPSSARRPERQP